MMVCDDDEMFYLHILASLLENRRKTWCLMYVRVVPARRLVCVAFFAPKGVQTLRYNFPSLRTLFCNQYLLAPKFSSTNSPKKISGTNGLK